MLASKIIVSPSPMVANYVSSKSHSHLITLRINLKRINVAKRKFKQIIKVREINGGRSITNPYLGNLEGWR